MNQKWKFFNSIRYDFPASIVVFLVALPLCLGIAMGSQVPLYSGLIAGIIGGIIGGILSGSQLSISGPAAGLITIVAAGITQLPSLESFFLAVVIAGILQVFLGFLKAGIIGDYVPSSVIKGMLAAIGLILILKQLPHLSGYDQDFDGDESFIQQDHQNTFTAIENALSYITPLALVIGVVGILFQFFWEKYTASKKSAIKLIPAPLIVVLMGIGINYAFKSLGNMEQAHLVEIPVADSFNKLFSFFTFPDWSQWLNKDVWMLALTLTIVASLETLLSIEAIDNLDPLKRVSPSNRELKAQGISNILSGLLGGLPITSVIVRSSANVNAGAQSKASSILHGILLLVFVALFPSLLNLIPKASLAAILIYTGYKLATPTLFISFYKKGWDQFIPFLVTVVAILLTDLLKGVAIGILVGLFYVLRSNFRSAIFVMKDGDRFLFRLKKDVSFLNKPILKSELESVPKNGYVLIDTSKADFIDKDVIDVVEDFMKHAHLKNISVELKKSNAQDFFSQHGFDNSSMGGYNKVATPSSKSILLDTPETLNTKNQS